MAVIKRISPVLLFLLCRMAMQYSESNLPSTVCTYIFCRFSEVQGMTEINDKEFVVTVKGPYTFSIGDTSAFSGGQL
jgi:hypothetical protein